MRDAGSKISQLSRRARSRGVKPLWSAPIVLAALLLAGCSSAPRSSESSSWTPGHYRVSGIVSYRVDSNGGQRNERREVWGDVIVEDGETISMDMTSEGLCIDPEPSVLKRQLLLGVRSFQCDQTEFTIRPGFNNVRGTVSVRVEEMIRVRGPCLQTERLASGATRCTQYSYDLKRVVGTKRVPIRSQRIDP